LKERGRVGDKLIEVLRELNALGNLPEDEQMTLF
jgi:DNA polymerase III alpha subunit (gram-positive type)